MNTQQIETFKGLVKSNEISDLGFLKRSSSTKFFEDATHFTKAVLKDLKIDSEKHLETEYFDTSIFEYMTIYVSSDLKLESQDKIKIMEECGITVAKSPSIIGKTLFNKLSN